MRAKYVGKGPDKIIITVKNKETSATIPLGAPVIFNLSSTAATDNRDDGRDVVLPSTAGVANYQLGAGVNIGANYPLAVGDFGEALVYGYCQYTLVKLRTRAATTDTWASIATVASGNLLTPDFTNNVWGTLANVAAQSSPGVILLDTLASAATGNSIAGGVGDTKLVSTGLYRSFVRLM